MRGGPPNLRTSRALWASCEADRRPGRVGAAVGASVDGSGYRRGDVRWLTGLCLSRFLIALVFTSYAAVLPVLQREWQMSAAAAGAIASAFQIGYASSLVGFNLLSDRIGARPAFLYSSLAGAPMAMAFALLANGPVSAALLYGLTALSIGGNYTPGLILIAERFPAATRRSE